MRSRRKSPWTDYKGSSIYEGDTIINCDGEKGRVIYDGAFKSGLVCWKVDYGKKYRGGYKPLLAVQVEEYQAFVKKEPSIDKKWFRMPSILRKSGIIGRRL